MKPSAVFVEIDEIPRWNPAWKWDHPENALAYGMYPTIYMFDNEAGEDFDWRFLTGCRVMVNCPIITANVQTFLDRLVKCGSTVITCMSSMDDKLWQHNDAGWKKWDLTTEKEQ